jgi:predicted nucleotidyltransferase component of viral defense system
MQDNIELNEIALKLGMGVDKLRKDIGTYRAISEIFPMLETEECKVGLFGGTAMNKLYYGKMQRLSYDLDIFSYSYKKTVKLLDEHAAVLKYEGAFPGRKAQSSRMMYKGIELDIVSVSNTAEEPKKMQMTDLLYYYGQLMPPVTVPSYSLEYLLADKTITMANRNELKDIYDTWLGTKFLKDKHAYHSYLEKISKGLGIKDVHSYLDSQMTMMLSNLDYYGKKHIEVVYQPSPVLMLRDITAFLKTWA